MDAKEFWSMMEMSETQTVTTGAYALGDKTRERERIDMQAALLRPATERLLHDAGISVGKRVLDVGTGTGDVAMLVAELVGPSGSVVAVDRSPEMVSTTRRRAIERGHTHVETLATDINALPDLGGFDAVVGRLILMHQPDPSATLRHLARLVTPGGTIAFMEFALPARSSWPHRPLFEQTLAWVNESLRRAGVRVDLGMELYTTFRQAGLCSPQVRLEPLVETGEAPKLHRLLIGITQTCIPLIEKFGIATREQIGIETLESRLRAEATTTDGLSIGPTIGSAWTRIAA